MPPSESALLAWAKVDGVQLVSDNLVMGWSLGALLFFGLAVKAREEAVWWRDLGRDASRRPATFYWRAQAWRTDVGGFDGVNDYARPRMRSAIRAERLMLMLCAICLAAQAAQLVSL